MARYSDVYLQENFGADSDGTLFEFEIIYYMTGKVGSLKNADHRNFVPTDFGNMGDDVRLQS